MSNNFQVEPLNINQINRLKFLLNDWKDNISPDDKETQEIVMEDIVNKMSKGVE